MTIYSLGVYYTHTFSAEEDVPIPGFSAGPLGGVYLRVKLTREDLSLKLKVIGVMLYVLHCNIVDGTPVSVASPD